MYGVFASCEVPIELPLVAPLEDTDEVAAFEMRAGEIRQRLADHIDVQYTQLLDTARRRVPEYLERVATTDPSFVETSVFFMSLSPDDLRPQIIQRRRRHINAHCDSHDPVFGLWGELLSGNETGESFAPRANGVMQRWADRREGTSGGQINAIVWAQLQSAPLQSADDVAKAYGRAFLAAWQHWKDAGSNLDALDACIDSWPSYWLSPRAPFFFDENTRTCIYGAGRARDVSRPAERAR